MRIQITKRHCEVPEDALARAEEQVEALSRYDARATAADVIFSEEKTTRHAEVIVHIDGAEMVVARGDGAEFRAAVDKMIDRASTILRKRREKRRDHQSLPLADRVTTD